MFNVNNFKKTVPYCNLTLTCKLRLVKSILKVEAVHRKIEGMSNLNLHSSGLILKTKNCRHGNIFQN